MGALWLLLFLAGIAILVPALVHLVSGKREPSPTRDLISARQPGGPERLIFLAWGVRFFVMPLPAIWFAAGLAAAPRQADGIAWGLVAISWIILGCVPLAVAAVRGEPHLSELRRKMELYCRSSLASLMRYWIAGIAALALCFGFTG